MMKKNYVISLCLILLLTGCSSVQTISFDRLQAADVSFPEVIKKVGIVNNIPGIQETDMEQFRKSAVFEGDGKVMAEALAQEIAATNYFDEVVICDSALCPASFTLKSIEGSKEEWEGHMLSKAVAGEWLEKLNVDMLISVERARIGLENGTALSAWQEPVKVIDGIITPMVRIYVPNRDKPAFTLTKTDTIFWSAHATLTIGKVVKESSEYAATMLMPYLIPYWKEVSRNYYDGGCVEMRDAGVYLREGDWEEAYALWKKVYDTRKGIKKMKASFNLALYSEMQNELEQALEYLKVAEGLVEKDSYDAILVRTYQIKLAALVDKNQKLQIQMKRFDDKY